MNTRQLEQESGRQPEEAFPRQPGQLERLIETLTRHYRELGLSEPRARASALADFAREAAFLR